VVCSLLCSWALVSGQESKAADEATFTTRTGTDQYGDRLPAGALARIGTTRLRDRAWDLAFSPDNKLLVSAGDGLRLWDVQTGELLHVFPHASPRRVAFSPDGKLLASGGWAGEVLLFDLASRRETARLLSPQEEIHALAFSPDGRLLASAGNDRSRKDQNARVWDVASGKLLWKLQAHDGFTYSMIISADGKTLVTGGDDGTIRFWDVPTRQETRRFQGHSGQVMSLALSADGKTLVSAGLKGKDPDEVNAWDVPTGKNVFKLKEQGHWFAAVLARDGKTVAVIEPASVKLHPTVPGAASTTLDVSSSVIAFSSDNRFLATTGVGRAIQIWNLSTNKPIHDLGGHQQQITALTFAGKDKYLACASTEKAILWEAKTGKKVRILHEKLRWDPALVASADGKFLGVASEEIALWDVEGGQVAHRFARSELAGPYLASSYLAFSPDSRSLMFPSYHGGLVRWTCPRAKNQAGSGQRNVITFFHLSKPFEGSWQVPGALNTSSGTLFPSPPAGNSSWRADPTHGTLKEFAPCGRQLPEKRRTSFFWKQVEASRSYLRMVDCWQRPRTSFLNTTSLVFGA
jgi:WD40 repeat protein